MIGVERKMGLLFAAVLGGALVCAAGVARNDDPKTVKVWVKVHHVFGNEQLRLDDVSLRTGGDVGGVGGVGGQTVSVSRLAYLVSGVRLIGADGAKVGGVDKAVFINASADRDSFEVTGVPAGNYTGLEFDIGLSPEVNHSDPAVYAPDHALNPLVNGLHWGWQGGYVFMAIEGRYQLPGDALGGYSYHIGNDARLMHVSLKREMDTTGDRLLTVVFDVARVFGGSGAGGGETIAIRHEDGSDSTHSGEGDLLAPRLAANVAGAFALTSVAAFDAPLSISTAAVTAPPRGTAPFELNIPSHFPQVMLPGDNPLTREGVALGEQLFFDRILSADGTQSCASCHQSASAFADGGKRRSTGVDGLEGKRNAMPLFNLAWARSMTWDGKRTRIRDQAIAPIQDEREMHLSLEKAVAKLEADAAYPGLFERAFGSPGVSAPRLGLALEQFLLTLISADSKFDRALRRQEALTPQETRGLELFITEFDPARGKLGADCFHCHGGNLFTDNEFKNNGLAALFPALETDLGRGEVTGKASDSDKFKVPSLRNIAATAPYMHDGRFATLADVIAHYAGGVKPSATLDPNLAKHPDGGVRLPPEDRLALEAFLLTLTDASFLARKAK